MAFKSRHSNIQVDQEPLYTKSAGASGNVPVYDENGFIIDGGASLSSLGGGGGGGAENTANKDTVNGYVGLSSWKIKFRNLANTFTSFLANAATAARTYTFQDRDGTIADDTDIAAAKNRDNHTGTQSADTITDGTTNKAFTASEKIKLDALPSDLSNYTSTNGVSLVNTDPTTSTVSTIKETPNGVILKAVDSSGNNVYGIEVDVSSVTPLKIYGSQAISPMMTMHNGDDSNPISPYFLELTQDTIVTTGNIIGCTVDNSSCAVTPYNIQMGPGHDPASSATVQGLTVGPSVANPGVVMKYYPATKFGANYFTRLAFDPTTTVSGIKTVTIPKRTGTIQLVEPIFTLTDNVSVTPSATVSNTFKWTLGGNRTLIAISNAVTNQTYRFLIYQDATGGRTVGFTGTYIFPTGTAPTLNAAPNAINEFEFLYDGTNFICTNVKTIANIVENIQTLTDAATIAWDSNLGLTAKVTLAGNRTLGAISNPISGKRYLITVYQDATGSRTLAFNAAYKFPTGTAPTLNSAATNFTILPFLYDGTNFIYIK